MVKSNYLTHPMEWEERIRVMEENLNNGFYDFLYFNISLNIIDAQDNADYDREMILGRMLACYKRGAINSIQGYINKLREML